jgi:hypothetical protein
MMPDRERDALLQLARPALVIADWIGAAFRTLHRNDLGDADLFDDRPLLDRVSNPGKAVASGGSTGRPKIIVAPGPWARVPGTSVPFLAAAGFGMDHIQLVVAPLYHNAPFITSYHGLFDDNTLVLLERFDAERAVTAVEQYHVQSMYLSPILMQRPTWRPISWLPTVSSVIDGGLAAAQELHRSLAQGAARPYSLDEATLARVRRVYGDQAEDVELFAEQVRRWQAEALTEAQRQEVARLAGQVVAWRREVTAILELVADEKDNTIEALMRKSDLEVGIEALLSQV